MCANEKSVELILIIFNNISLEYLYPVMYEPWCRSWECMEWKRTPHNCDVSKNCGKIL